MVPLFMLSFLWITTIYPEPTSTGFLPLAVAVTTFVVCAMWDYEFFYKE